MHWKDVLLKLACVLGLLASIGAWQRSAAAQESPVVDPNHAANMKQGLEIFKRDVRRLLVGRCIKCHGGESTEGEFDLTTRDGLLKGGESGRAVVSGKSSESRLVKLIAHEEEPTMPAGGAKLDDRQIAAIARWIDLGAPYDQPLVDKNDDPLAWTTRKVEVGARDFWSFQPLAAPEPPATSDGWARGEIDRFLLARLREKQLAPRPLADKRVLIRRAYYDLLGLPPPAEEVTRFLQDQDPEAWPKLLDRLLESPHYGERWGRHWLDVARFAESFGFEQDYDRPHAYHYRDFVIRALNADMPYDQFVRWQLAGDELAPDDPLALMATGFLGAGVFPTQLTEKEFEPARYDELDDMVSTIGTSMLGLTIGCARCHDHKFDPIPAADYYRLAAVFTKTVRSNIPLDLDPAGFQRRRAEHDAAHAPLVEAWKKHEQAELAPRFDKWLVDRQGTKAPAAKWKRLDLASFRSAGGAKMEKLDDGSVLVTGDNPNHDAYTLVAETRMRQITAVRLETLTHPSLVKNGPGRAQNGNFALTHFQVQVQPLADPGAQPATVKMVAARATHQQNDGQLAVAGAIDDDGHASGWAVDGGGIGQDQAAVFDFEKPIDFEGGVRITFQFTFGNNVQHAIGRPRLSLATDPVPVAIDGETIEQPVADALAILDAGRPAKELNDAQRDAIRKWFFAQDAKWQTLRQAVVDHQKQEPQPALTTVMVASEGFKPIPHHADDRGFPHFYPETHFLKRGDAAQKQGVANPGYLQVLVSAERENPWRVESPAGSRTSHQRQALAAWVTDTQRGAGALLARVITNRVWQHHFGRGIVATPNDFGFQGERPSHPELLDWLATGLVRDGWRLKPLHKRIMTSAAYMQGSSADAAAVGADPSNVLVWRYTPRRLEAEIIRDAMLATSDQLDRTPFGPGTLEEGMKRRSIYFMIKRSKLIPMMQIFDSPEPLVSVGERPATTIAPQALLFMNNTQVRDCARGLGRRLAPVAERSPEEAIRDGYLTTISRQPTDAERAAALEFLASQVASYTADKHANPREAAWTDFAQVLFSLNEFLFVE